MSNCSILRIGPIDSENGNAAMLRSAIANHFHRDSSWASSSSSSGAEDSRNNLLAISNRYFDASILLSGLAESFNDVTINGETISHPQEDGIILIFDVSISSSFDTLGQHHSTAVQNDQCGELLRLCIGVTHGPSPLSDGSKQSEEEYSRRVLWCLDHGYEYVEVDLTPEGMARGFDERDKDGFARVVEATSTCMWSSHVMKRRDVGGGNVGVGSSVSATVLKKDVENDESGESQSKSQYHATEKETETISSPANDSEREKAAIASLMQRINNEPETDTIAKEENTQQQQQDEMAFHQLEHVLSEAKLIRDASKHNSMSDDERRERAGDTAMKLMGLLDRLGLEDDDTEDEGSHSSEDE